MNDKAINQLFFNIDLAKLKENIKLFFIFIFGGENRYFYNHFLIFIYQKLIINFLI